MRDIVGGRNVSVSDIAETCYIEQRSAYFENMSNVKRSVLHADTIVIRLCEVNRCPRLPIFGGAPSVEMLDVGEEAILWVASLRAQDIATQVAGRPILNEMKARRHHVLNLSGTRSHNGYSTYIYCLRHTGTYFL